MLAGVAVGLVWVLWPTGALAQSGDDELARVHFEAGSSYYDRGEYERAVEEFQRSYELSQRPTLFYNLSLAYQQLGRLTEASDYLGRYLTEVENVPNRANLERRLQNLRSRTETTGDTTPPDTAVPEPDGTETSPPVDSASATTPTDLTFQEAATTDAPPQGDAASGGGGGVPVLSIVSFAAAGAGLVMMTTFGLLAISERSSVEDGCGSNRSCSASDVSTMDTFALLSDLGLGVAVVGAGLGLLFLFVGNDAEVESSSVASLAPWADTTGGGLSLRGVL